MSFNQVARRRMQLMRRKSRRKLTSEEELEYGELNRIIETVGQNIPRPSFRDCSLPDRTALERVYDKIYPEEES